MNHFFNQNSLLSRVDVRLKIILSCYLSVVVVLIDSPYLLAVTAICGLGLLIIGIPSRMQIKLTLFTVIPLVWGIMISQGMFYNRFPREMIVEFLEPNWFFREGLRLYLQGIYHGLIQSLRMITMVLTGYAICFSTPPESFLRGLTALKCPYSFSFMASSAIRFIPVTAMEFRTVRSALRLKGYKPFRNGLIDTIKTEIYILRPILAATIRRSEDVALSIITRGFSFSEQRTTLYELKINRREWGVIICMGIVVLAVVCCKLLFWLYRYEIFYHASLRPIYHFCRYVL